MTLAAATDRLAVDPGGVRHARDLPLWLRLAAYLVMLAGYFFYCYNFLVLDYVRPYMIAHLGIDLRATANISLIGNLFVTAGSLLAAPMLARIGRRISLAAIALWIGAFAAAMAVARSIDSLLAIRALLSVGLGAYYVAGINLTVALFPTHQRAKLAAVNSAMFSLAEIVIGVLGGALGDAGWRWMLWLGGVPLLVAPLMLLIIPRDRSYVPFGADEPVQAPSGGWAEMLSRKWRRITLSCVFLAGLNFIGYQLFSSFITVYLKTDRHFAAADMGAIVAMTGTGSLLGGFAWAFAADRFGRRLNGNGFVLTAVAICLFLVAPDNRPLLQAIGFVYGVGLSSAYCWGIWFTEMFPLRLRPYGAALFHGGHVVSLAAPLLVAWSADRWGLTFAMALAPVAFALAAILWFTLPETLRTSSAYRGWEPEAR